MPLNMLRAPSASNRQFLAPVIYLSPTIVYITQKTVLVTSIFQIPNIVEDIS